MDADGMDVEEIERLLRQAMRRYHPKIFDNICERTVQGRPLAGRLRSVGKAIMERTDRDGYLLGLKLIEASERLENGEC